MPSIEDVKRVQASHLGLMLVIFSPDFEGTNSLLMNNPIGCVYLRPLGAVRSTKRSDMIDGVVEIGSRKKREIR